MGVVYLCAFASLVPQIAALVGTDGLLPVTEFLERVSLERLEGWWRLPTLAWLSGSDLFLQFLCVAGALLSILVALGVLPLPSLVLCWVLYLSLKWAGQTFLSFQWDILLLETGFLSSENKIGCRKLVFYRWKILLKNFGRRKIILAVGN